MKMEMNSGGTELNCVQYYIYSRMITNSCIIGCRIMITYIYMFKVDTSENTHTSCPSTKHQSKFKGVKDKLCSNSEKQN